MNDAQLLETLRGRGDLSSNNVHMLKRFMNEWKVSAFDAIVESKIISEGRLSDIIAEQGQMVRMQIIDCAVIDHEVLLNLPYLVARQLNCLPLRKDRQGRVVVVIADPTDLEV